MKTIVYYLICFIFLLNLLHGSKEQAKLRKIFKEKIPSPLIFLQNSNYLANDEGTPNTTSSNTTKTELNTEKNASNTLNENQSVSSSEEEKNEEQKQIDYSVLDNEDFGSEIKDLQDSYKKSSENSMKILGSLTKNINSSIDNLASHIETKIEEFSEKILNKSNELDKLCLFNEFKLLKLTVQIIKSDLSELLSKIIKAKSSLANLLKNIPIKIKTICSLYTSCSECLLNTHCGWCQEKQECILGSENGPEFDFCQFFNYEKCDDNNCLKYHDCNSCLEDPFCGWCVDEYENTEGCLPGQENFKSCPLWIYSNIDYKAKCPEPLNKKKKNLNDDPINFDDIPEKQRIIILNKQKEVIEVNEKIAKLQQEINLFEKKIAFYEEKYRDINRKINIDEINEIRENIFMRKISRKNEVEEENKKNMQNSLSNSINSAKANASNEENSQKEQEITDSNLDLGSEASLEFLSL